MSKTEENFCKKTLVRNTSEKLPKTKLVSDKPPESQGKIEGSTPTIENVTAKTNFEQPELNSTLKLTRKLDAVEKVKPMSIKSCPHLAFDEKMTRLVNFPANKPVFRDLIPLQKTTKSQAVLPTRGPINQKDKEPILSDFVKNAEGKECVFQPEVKLDAAKKSDVAVDNLKLHKIMQIDQ